MGAATVVFKATYPNPLKKMSGIRTPEVSMGVPSAFVGSWQLMLRMAELIEVLS